MGYTLIMGSICSICSCCSNNDELFIHSSGREVSDCVISLGVLITTFIYEEETVLYNVPEDFRP